MKYNVWRFRSTFILLTCGLVFSLFWIFSERAGTAETGVVSLLPDKEIGSSGSTWSGSESFLKSEANRAVNTGEKTDAFLMLEKRSSVSTLEEFLINLAKIKDEFGDGKKAHNAALLLARDSSVPVSEILDYLNALEDEELFLHCKVGLSLRFSNNNLNSLSDVADIQSLRASPIGKELLVNGMSYYVFSTRNENVRARMNEVYDTLFVGSRIDKNLEDIVMRISGEGDSAQRVEDFVSVFGEVLIRKKEDGEFFEKMFQSWTGSEAIAGLKSLGTSVDELDPEAVWIIAKNALEHSPPEALNILNKSNEGVRAAIIENYLISDELDKAKAEFKSTEFNAEEVREKVEWHLWDVQQKAVRREVRQNPLETVNSLLNGTSEYDQNFLETAVTHWIVKDPEQAADWVEANIDQMAHGPRQYVAASYAKEAAAQGDMATARQWANLIKDEKTLTRINGILKKAEQAASN